MKNQIIRVNVTLNNNNLDGVKIEAVVYEIVFTEYSTLIDTSVMLSKLTKVIKQIGGWSMITVDATIKDSGDYSNPEPRQVLHSIRYVNEYGRIRQMEWTNGCKFMDSTEYPSESKALKAVKDSVTFACHRANEALVASIQQSKVN